MKIKSYLALPLLLDSLPLSYAADSLWLKSLALVEPHGGTGGRFEYLVQLIKADNGFKVDVNTPAGAYCNVGPGSRISGEIQILCHDSAVPTGYQVQGLNVRIQQPENGSPDTGGFNVLINWK